jgi:hypothetical protein
MRREILFAIGALILASLACSITLNVPEIQTGPTETYTVSQGMPTGGNTANVNLNMGAGTFNLTGGAEGLLNGTVRYNVAAWKPTLSVSGSTVTLKQGTTGGFTGLPTGNIVNEWDLKLSDTAIIDLNVEAGAYKGELDLGGVHLSNLSISDGASQSTVTFSTPNPEPMEQFTYKTGASQIKLNDLANANFSDMSFAGGAGNYMLDFSGDLQRDANVTIRAGVSSVTITIPSGMNAEITNSGGLSNIDTQGTWTVNNNTYSSGGSGPLLSITVEMGVGNLKLIHE